MKLCTSTGDFSYYVDNVTEKIKCFKGLKFKHINLEQTGSIPEFFSENDENWKRLADDWSNAAAYAGVKFVVSHAPCLDATVPDALENHDNEEYKTILRALKRSIEICHRLNIGRIVVHPCTNEKFSVDGLYEYNKMFYGDLLELAEKYNIILLTENIPDNSLHFSTGKEMRDFLDFMNHPLLAACWDTAHGNIDLVSRQIGQYENIVALGDKLKGLHISDNFGDCHHHSWPFAGIINFDSVMQGLLDVNYDGYFTFEASYTLLHNSNPPYGRQPWMHNGEVVRKLLSPSIELKKKAVDLLYETGKYILETYNCLEE